MIGGVPQDFYQLKQYEMSKKMEKRWPREQKWPRFRNATRLDVVCWSTTPKGCQYGQMVCHLQAFVQQFNRASIVFRCRCFGTGTHGNFAAYRRKGILYSKCWHGILLSCHTEFSPKAYFVATCHDVVHNAGLTSLITLWFKGLR